MSREERLSSAPGPPPNLTTLRARLRNHARTIGEIDTRVQRISADVACPDYTPVSSRPRGCPPIGDGPAELVPVRLDPALKAAFASRANVDQTTLSDVIAPRCAATSTRAWPVGRRPISSGHSQRGGSRLRRRSGGMSPGCWTRGISFE